MGRWRHSLNTLVLAVAAAAACPAEAGSVESSYRAARAILEESLSSTGAGDWLDHGGAVLMHSRGTWNLGVERQGYTPTDRTPVSLEETWAFHPLHGKLAREVRYEAPDGTPVWERELYIGDQQRIVVDLARDRATLYQDDRLVGLRSAVLRRWLPTLLAEVQDNPSALRSLGRYGPFDGIQAVTHDGNSLSLFFGRESRHLGWVEYLADLPTWADSTVSWKFSDYRTVEGLGDVPHAWAVLVNEQPLAEMQVQRVTSDSEAVARFLAIPQDAVMAPDPRRGAMVTSLADGVWQVTTADGTHHAMAIEFDESLLLIDAPAPRPALYALPARSHTGQVESGFTDDILGALEGAIPGKRVSGVALTHFHAEHAGGLRSVAEAGAKIYALASEAEAVREFMDREHTLCATTGVEIKPEVEEVVRQRVLQDGSQKVVLMDVGANPHTAGLLAVWLPGPRILYLADLITPRDGGLDPLQGRLNRFTLKWLQQSGLDPSLVLTAHGAGRIEDIASQLGPTAQVVQHQP